MVIFAVQNGGWCAAAGNLNGYRKYGKAGNCKNGKGGPWANDVYRITNPIKPALPKGIFTVETQAMGVTLIRIIIITKFYRLAQIVDYLKIETRNVHKKC